MNEPDPNPFLPRMARIAGAALLALYFAWFLRDALSMQFAADDPMNMGTPVAVGIRRVIGANLTFWSSFYRPMGGLFYAILFRLAKFNPLPYHLAIQALLGLNVWLTYRIAKVITASDLTAWITALLLIYHGRLTDLYYLPSFIYDVLCYCFYYSAFLYYLRIREMEHRLFRAYEVGVFLALFICALNSKETAVTLPLMVGIFEILYHPPASWRSWPWKQGLPAAIGLLISIGFMAGKALGPDSLVNMPAYRPVFTLERFLSQHSMFLNALTYSGFFNPTRTAVFYLLAIYIAVTRRSRIIGLAISLAVLGTLPVSFIVGRAGAPLYIASLGWALLVSIAAVGIVRLLVREPLFRWLPQPVAQGVLVAFGVAMLCRLNSLQREIAVAYVHRDQAKTWNMIGQFQRNSPKLRPNSRMLILDDPFDGFDTVFIARLWYEDPTSHFYLGRKMEARPTGTQLNEFHYIITFDSQGRLIQVKP